MRLGQDEESALGIRSATASPSITRRRTGANCRADQAELERRARELEDQPSLADTLHPRSDKRDELPAPEHEKVAMVQGAEAGREREPGRDAPRGQLAPTRTRNSFALSCFHC